MNEIPAFLLGGDFPGFVQVEHLPYDRLPILREMDGLDQFSYLSVAHLLNLILSLSEGIPLVTSCHWLSWSTS